MFNRQFILILLSAINTAAFYSLSFSQGCCSGGSGSPIAGGASQGVLQERQMELAISYQYIQSDKFFAGDRDTIPLFKDYFSHYLYFRSAYGITDKLTFSTEAGYYLKKQQIGRNDDTSSSKGIGDLILFPKYNLYNLTEEHRRVEITAGLGWKIPLGSYNDSCIVFRDTANNINYYTIAPPTVQPTTGSHDFIGYLFFVRAFPKPNFRIFANSMYILKGWNGLGEKFGDYSSVSLFFSKTFFKKLGATVQLKAEHISKMKAAKNTDLLAFYNVEIQSTGMKKLVLAPQFSFTQNSLTLFALGEFPLYQYVNRQQIASKTQVTIGLSYRFFVVKSKIPTDGSEYYACPMKCEGGGDTKPGKCKVCGMKTNKVQ